MIEADEQEQRHDRHLTHLILVLTEMQGTPAGMEGNALSPGCSPATATHQWGTISVDRFTCHCGQRPINILPTSTVEASPEGGRRQSYFLVEMTWGRRRLVYHLSLEGFLEFVISENLPHG